MVCSTLSSGAAVGAVLGFITLTGCSSKSKDRSPDWARNTEAVSRTAAVQPMNADAERQALQRFSDFYAVYSPEAIRAGVRRVYDENAWFGDPFRIVEGMDEIEHYFLVMAEPVKSCTFSVDSISRSGIDYFARWTMELESKAAEGEIIRTIGISHVRFNASGKVVFQQDYWDASAMLDRLPVVGYWTRLVKDRIEKGLEK